MSIFSPVPTTFIMDLRDGAAVDEVFLVSGSEMRRTRAGASFLTLTLRDRTGTVAAVVWDEVDRNREIVALGEPLRVVGSYAQTARYGPQVTVDAVTAPEHVDWDRLVDGPAVPAAELERRLDALLDTVADDQLHGLLLALLGTNTVRGALFRRACAAQYNHHAYRAGLLEHSLAVADAVDAASQIFPDIHRDLAVCGALLHDIGKLDAYTLSGHGATFADTGRLIGEIPSGYYTLRREIEEMPGFPPALAEQLLHIILSHHGCLEHGSPIVPATREALVVHAMDKLSGDLGSVDRLQRETPPDQRWSRYDRALGRAMLVNPDTDRSR